MEGFFDLLKKHTDFDILNSAMEGLIKVVEMNYSFMGEYIPSLLNLTEVLMAKPSTDEDNKKIAQYSIEIWMTLCDVELEQNSDPVPQNRLNLIL